MQSLDDEVLKESNRGHNPETVYNSSELIRDDGFELGIQTMIGLPGDDFEKDLSTATSSYIKTQSSENLSYPSYKGYLS